MLVALSIKDIVLIDRLDLSFCDGLSVLTGETGAGKSILLDSLALALGGRGDGSLVRHGASQGQVIAVFDPPVDHPARVAAQVAGFDVEGDLILRRIQMADGRTRAFVNDSPVSAQIMRQIGALLVEIHGQHADRAMVDPATHRALIDGFAGLGEDVILIGQLHTAWRQSVKRLEEAEARIEAARKEADFLRHAHQELAKLAPETGEEEQLALERQTLMRAEKSIADLKDAHDLLMRDNPPHSVLVAVGRRLDRRKEGGSAALLACLQALDHTLIALDEVQINLEEALRETKFDPHKLEKIEERLFALRAAARKYHVPVAELAALAQRFEEDLDALDAGEGQLVHLRKAVEEGEKKLRVQAQNVSVLRQKAAANLDTLVSQELPPLKLERAKFTSEIDSDAARLEASGIDRVEFYVSTNPGSRPGPMMKIASGGELARFMLALKVVLADKASAPTLVFDEIDTGVGGAVADAIGARLARLAAGVQVLAVTHAPQVAARASSHFHIAKGMDEKNERVVTRVVKMDETARQEEIARMLSGAEITDEARAAAAKLLKR